MMDSKTLAQEFRDIWDETDAQAIGPIEIKADVPKGIVELVSEKTGISISLKFDRPEIFSGGFNNKNAELAAIDRAFDFRNS